MKAGGLVRLTAREDFSLRTTLNLSSCHVPVELFYFAPDCRNCVCMCVVHLSGAVSMQYTLYKITLLITTVVYYNCSTG